MKNEKVVVRWLYTHSIDSTHVNQTHTLYVDRALKMFLEVKFRHSEMHRCKTEVDFGAEVNTLQPLGQPPVFINKIVLNHSHAIVSGLLWLLHAPVAEFSSYRSSMVCKA